MQEILQYLKLKGEQLDSEIAAATGLSVAKVRMSVSELSAKGEIIACRSIRFKDGKAIDGMLYRMSGYIPPPTPGRKAKAQT
jgi:hypothetical protein